MKRWMNVELQVENLNKGDAEKFREFCKMNNWKFETSYAGDGYVHFEVYLSETEVSKANQFLDLL